MPGTIGTPADSAISRALTLLPIRVMACVDGPMNVMPEAWQSSANSAFSDRNPYPGMDGIGADPFGEIHDLFAVQETLHRPGPD